MSATPREARRIVVKVGSSLVTNEGRGVDPDAVGDWCRQMAELVREGRELVMVSSGAIAEGMKRLGWPARPRGVHELQAAAAAQAERDPRFDDEPERAGGRPSRSDADVDAPR